MLLFNLLRTHEIHERILSYANTQTRIRTSNKLLLYRMVNLWSVSSIVVRSSCMCQRDRKKKAFRIQLSCYRNYVTLTINEIVELAKATWMPLVNIVCFYQYFTLLQQEQRRLRRRADVHTHKPHDQTIATDRQLIAEFGKVLRAICLLVNSDGCI